MLYVPAISDYKPFYIQYGTNTIVDLLNDYKVVIKTHDYPMALKAKEPYKNDWKDQHGDEEYIGSNGLYFEAFTFTLECAMFASSSTEDGAIADLNVGIRAFRSLLAQGLFKTYDSWTGFGFKDVRLQEFPMPDSSAYSVWGQKPLGSDTREYRTRVIFKVILKVNDPASHLVYDDGNILVSQ